MTDEEEMKTLEERRICRDHNNYYLVAFPFFMLDARLLKAL